MRGRSEMDCEISVIVPVYNVEPFLERCINSVLSQSFGDFELLLIDDGSTDRCPEICDNFVKKDARVRVIHQSNRGVSAARNVGIGCSGGKYITFVDSDDVIHRDYLLKLHSALLDYSADVSVCDFKYLFEKFDETFQSMGMIHCFSGREACKQIYTSDCENDALSMVTLWGKLYPRRLFHNVRFPEGRIHEDQFVVYKLLYGCKKVVEIQEYLYGYNCNVNGIIRSSFTNKRYDDIIALDEAIEFYKRNSDIELVNLASDLKTVLIAKYAIMARKAGIYRKVPQIYKMNLLDAANKVREMYGRDYYEAFMVRYYPYLVYIEAYIRKIREVLNNIRG